MSLSGLVGTGAEGELVRGGVESQTHAIFRQITSQLEQLGLGLEDVVKCLVMIDDFNNGVASTRNTPPTLSRHTLLAAPFVQIA